MLIRTVASAFLVVGLCVTGSTWGAAYYVATTGSDATGDGSLGNPWATINKGLTGRAAGDVVNVATGSYSGGNMTIMAGVSLVGAGSGLTTYNYTSPGAFSYAFNHSGNTDATFNTVIQGINFNSTGVDGGFISFGSPVLTTTKMVVQDVILQNFLATGTGRVFNFNPLRSELQLIDVDMLNNTGGAFFRYRSFGTNSHTITITGGTWTGNTQNVFDVNATVTGLKDLSIDGLTYTGNTKDFSLFGTTQGNVTIQNSVFGGNAGTIGLNLGTLDVAAVVTVLNNEFKNSTTGLGMAGTPTTPVTIQGNDFINTTTGAQGGGATDAYDYWASNTFTGVTTNHAGFNTIAIPEPASLALLTLGGLMMIRRRR